MASMPQSGMRYRVQLGRSIKEPDYKHFALRFAHLPNTLTDGAGVARRSDEKLNVNLPQADGAGMSLEGSRAPAGNSKMGEYILVFHEGVFYVERLSASFHNVRVTSTNAPRPNPPAPPPSDSNAPHVPWLDGEGLSPVTEDAHSGASDRADPATPAPVVPVPPVLPTPPVVPVSRAATKSTPSRVPSRPVSSRTPRKSLPAAGGVIKRRKSRSPSTSRESSPVRAPSPKPHVSTAGKSVAMKGLSTNDSRRTPPSPAPSSSSSSSESDDSSGDSSGESGDSSENESDYTDESSDEE